MLPSLFMKPLQIQEAKRQFEAVADRAASGTPQIITKQGKPYVVIISIAEWEKTLKPAGSLLKVLRACPVDVDDLDLTRSADRPQDLSW